MPPFDMELKYDLRHEATVATWDLVCANPGTLIKIKESKEAIKAGSSIPAWDIFVKRVGETRGRRFATLVCLES